jgi:hypothetical protein
MRAAIVWRRRSRAPRVVLILSFEVGHTKDLDAVTRPRFAR